MEAEHVLEPVDERGIRSSKAQTLGSAKRLAGHAALHEFRERGILSHRKAEFHVCSAAWW